MFPRKTQLVDLPHVLLAQILAEESASYAVVNLWKCGNWLLNHRLANGGCDTVILLDRNWTSTSRWPMMLTELNCLRSLRIVRDGYIMPVDLLSLELRKLAPTLESLELDCYGADTGLLNFAEHASCLSPPYQLTHTPRGDSRLWNIGEIYPKLQHLRVWEPNKMGSNCFEISDLVVLPPNLVSLAMNACFKEGDLSILPRYMESLTTGISDCAFNGDVSLLPPYLTWLDGFSCDEGDIEALAAYPRTITNCESFFGWSVFEPEMAAALPPCLKSLECCDSFATDEFEASGVHPWPLALPQTLTKLHLSTIPGEVVLNKCQIACLPRTLLELWNVQVDWESLDNAMDEGKRIAEYWPSSLRTLQFLEGFVSIDNCDRLRMLPHQLERLLSLEVETGFNFTRPFPPFLRELELIGTDVVLCTALPDSLEYIKCRGDFDFHHVGPFPETLSNAEILLSPGRCPVWQRFNFEMLPQELSSLTVTCCSTSCLGELPRGITWLTIIDLMGQPSPETFSRLPPNLSYLCIGQMRYDRSTCCTNMAFAALPKSLQSLRITHAVLPGSTLRYLPRNIRDIGLKFASLSAEDLQGMPTSQLRTFTPYELTEIPEIEPDVARYWPETPLTVSNMNVDEPPPLLDNIRTKHSFLRSRNQLYPDPRVIINA